MSPADDAFKPDTIIKAKKGESRWKVAANERTRIMIPHFIDRVRWEGVGWPRVIAPGATVTVVADCVNFGHGSGVDITVSDSESTFEETVHKTVYGCDVKLQIQVPPQARGILLVKVSIPNADRPNWDARLKKGDLERMAPAIKIVPSLLQQVRFETDQAVEGDDVSLTVQTSAGRERYRGSLEVGRMEEYGGQEVYIRHAGPFFEHPDPAGGFKVTWNVTTPTIDRREIRAQWQIDEAKAEAEENGETYDGPAEYRGIELIARARHLGLRADSTEASRSGPGDTGMLTVRDALHLTVVDEATAAPYSGLSVDLTLPDGSQESATTDSDGVISLEAIPPGPVRAVLTLEDGQVPSPEPGDGLPNDAEAVRAEWNRTEPTATAEIVTGTPQVLRLCAPGLSA